MNQFEGLSSFSAGLGRLATFVERMESYCDASECATDANATFVLSPEKLGSGAPGARSMVGAFRAQEERALVFCRFHFGSSA